MTALYSINFMAKKSLIMLWVLRTYLTSERVGEKRDRLLRERERERDRARRIERERERERDGKSMIYLV